MSEHEPTTSIHIAIIGCGVAGIASLVQLLSRPLLATKLTSIILLDSNPLGKSTPFSDESKHLYMNTSIGENSIIPHNKHHFLQWMKDNKDQWQQQHPKLKAVNLESFVPRHLYGQYLQETAQKYIAFAKSLNITVREIKQRVRRIIPVTNQQHLLTSDGQLHVADFVIVATGNRPIAPSYQHLSHLPQYFNSPYVPHTKYKQLSGKRLLIIGTHLTGIDTVRLLNASGYQGIVTLASHHGDLPAVRTETLDAKEYTAIFEHITDPYRLLELFYTNLELSQNNSFKQEYKLCAQGSAIWQRQVVPFINQMNSLWPTLSANTKERLKFLIKQNCSHYLSACNSQAAKELLSYIESNNLSITGNLKQVEYCHEKQVFIATFEMEQSSKKQFFDIVINATNLGDAAYQETHELRNTLRNYDAASNGSLKANPRVWAAGLAAHQQLAVANAVFIIARQATDVIDSLESAICNGQKVENTAA